MEQKNELLKKLYYDPLIGLSSKAKFYKKAKSFDNSITLKNIQDFLDSQATTQITKQVKQNKEYSTIVSPGVRNNYQMDIMYLPHPVQNENFKYLLTCIDVYSRYAFVKPMKTKTGPETYEAMKELFLENGKPVNLNVDEGKEFIYKPFKQYCEDNDITMWFSDTQQSNKNAIIERFHRTLRNFILRYETANGNAYIKELPNLIKNYNTTEHNTVKAIPALIWSGNATNLQTIKYIENEFKEGDKVRHVVEKAVFGKNSSTNTFTKTIYTVERVNGNTIYLQGLTKPFKSTELIKAIGENLDTSYDDRIKASSRSEVIKRRLKKAGLA